ncbi:MAG: M48 family metalloprotease [Burkholderia contaminans]|uniref:M48 family metalloprotease n=2 Tax=Pseudomonadota TaxID=1224 RepID=A0AAP4QYU3_9BURK|nr:MULTISPECIES: M48 family metalloprotease [Burkholderia]MBD1410538.1 M48 family metalloprotease [Burkholderia contaminans]MBM6427374.1 M48 family metalloprotease [Burkholderia contaminans]MCA7875649.1 M48 family metalloprotease [Burkholderia contaminans]MDN7564349.1 M48 family metalloprotease [Burkholderia contaminans]MDN8024100.1 M48 family metalloprotease [Burkholderia contaminans]
MKRFVARCTPWGTIQTGIFFRSLTAIEKDAVIAHERAHLIRRDPLRRLWWLLTLQLIFRPEWVFARVREQELAADQYVKEQGLAAGLRMFLRRHPHPGSALHPSSQERLEALHG